jgi:hypothetical protein
MSLTQVTVHGTLNADGTLELDEKPNLSPGRVQVTVAPLADLPRDDPFWQRMQAMWAAQESRGFVPRSAQEVEAERRQVRQEWEERMQRIEQVRAEAEAIRKARGPGT